MRLSMRLWPRSLMGQMLLAVAVVLLLAQAISAGLLWRAAEARRDERSAAASGSAAAAACAAASAFATASGESERDPRRRLEVRMGNGS